MIHVESEFGPGIVGIITDDLSRYPQFQASMLRLQVPGGSCFTQIRGKDIACNRNIVIQELPEGAEWVWFIDDDHPFPPDILLKLLARKVDIVQPLVSTRRPPFLPYGYKNTEPPYGLIDWSELPGEGLCETGAVGTGGMLVQRRVLDALEAPWFESGRTGPDALGEDLWFCTKARKKGFRTYVDLDTRMGHMTTTEVWPVFLDNKWKICLNLGSGLTVTLPADLAVQQPFLQEV